MSIRRLLCLAMSALFACAPATSVTRAHQLVPTELTARAGVDDFANGPLVVHIVNSTTQPYRLSLLFGGDVRLLGSVQGFEECNFIVDRRAIFGYAEFQLLAVGRAGAGRRESDRFTLGGVRAVDWSIDGTMTRYVRLR